MIEKNPTDIISTSDIHSPSDVQKWNVRYGDVPGKREFEEMLSTPTAGFKAKWLDFNEVPFKGKTKKFEVVNREQNFTIGEVKWYGAFRQYSFFPVPNTVYERQCLMDIAK